MSLKAGVTERESKAMPSDPEKRFVPLAHGPAAYTDEGQGPIVVAVHGLPGSGRDYRWFAPELTSFARVIRVDLPGFGQTPARTGEDASPLGRARFVLELMEALGVERCVIAGHSMGGVVACAAVSLSPDRFAGLMLLASPGVRTHRALRRFPYRLINGMLKRKTLTRRMRPITRRLFRLGGFKGYPDSELERTLLCVARTSMLAHASRVHALTTPTLAAWADDDPLIEAEFMTELAAVCPPGPRLHFAKGGHNVQKTHAVSIGEATKMWLPQLSFVRSS